MSKKTKSRVGAKKVSSAKKGSSTAKKATKAGGRRAAPAETTSGSERSALDPKRNSVFEVEETVPNVSGRLSGDLQNLPAEELEDSESVEELAEEGQDLEAELVLGVEDAPDADQGEVRTHRAPNKVTKFKDRNRI
jgi:hypothetical protein